MKRNKIKETEIDSILQKMNKPKAFNGYPYPLNDLSDREFEILLHHIFREKIEGGDFSGKFDHVDLMQGVGERGRDCVLTLQGKNRGVIQCKRYKNRLNGSDVVSEIIKFVLNFLEDNSLIDDLDNFTYYFAVSTGFTGKTIGYLRDFNNRIAQESRLREWTEGVIEKYKSLNHIKYSEIENDLKKVLRTIAIEKITPEEQIHSWIENSPAIIQCFFEVKLVVDVDFVEKRFQKFLTAIRPGGDEEIRDAIQRLVDHSSPILSTIFDTIRHSVHIDRSRIIHDVWDLIETHRMVFITGDPGIGKSALLKNFFTVLPEDIPFFAFKAEDFHASHIDKVFTDIGLRVSFLRLNSHLPSQPYKIAFVDGIEKLLEIHQDAFIQFLQFLSDDTSWRLIVTCRSYAVEQVRQNFFFQKDFAPFIYRIPPLSEREIESIQQEIPEMSLFTENIRLKRLLHIPFYLQQICLVHWENSNDLRELTETRLENILWASVIEKNSDDRRRCFIDIAVRRAKKMQLFVSPGEWPDTVLKELVNDEVLKKRQEPRGFAPAHDVFEDWALRRFIDGAFEELQHTPRELFDEIGHEPAMRRNFRIWLAERLDASENSYLSLFITSVLRDDTLPQYWKDEVLTAMLLSRNSEPYFTQEHHELLKNNGALLWYCIGILRTACWKPDEYELNATEGLGNAERSMLSTSMLIPAGSGWGTIIQFLHQHLDRMRSEELPMISGLLRDWSKGLKNGKPLPDGAREAGLLAFHILEHPPKRYNPILQEELCRVLVKVAQVLTPELGELIDKHFEAPKRHHTHYFNKFIERTLDFFDGSAMCRYMPEAVVKIALKTWLLPHDRINNEYHTDIEHHFDLTYESSHYFPASGLQGPFFSLLYFHPQHALDLILCLSNHAVEGYIKSDLIGMRPPHPPHVDDPHFKKLVSLHEEEDRLINVILSLNAKQTISQWGSPRLWQFYRGTAVGPDVLQSALMALENWLLDRLKAKHDLSSVFDLLLAQSNSVAITAVLASVATAYPKDIGERSLPLLSNREFFKWDLLRFAHEADARSLADMSSYMGFPTDAVKEFHYDDRRRSNSLKHRGLHLENFVQQLQFTSIRQTVHEIIDRWKSELPSPEIQGDEEKLWRICLKRMDMREYQSVVDKERLQIEFIPSEPDKDIKEFQEKDRPAFERQSRLLKLFNWGMAKFSHEKQKQEAFSSWQNALTEAQELYEYIRENPDDEPSRLHAGAPVYTAAVCVRDHLEQLTDNQLDWCAERIIESVALEMDHFFNDNVRVLKRGFKGAGPAAMVLPLLLPLCEAQEEDDDDEALQIIRYLIAASLLHPSEEARSFAIRGAHQYLWKDYPGFARACLEGMIEFAAFSRQFRYSRQGKDIQTHAEQTIQAIHKIREQVASLQTEQFTHIENVSFQTHDPSELIRALEMIPAEVHDEIYFTLFQDVLSEFIQDASEPHFARRGNYELQNLFDNLFARFTLNQPAEKALELCSPLLESLKTSPELAADMLESLVYMENRLLTPDSIETFWAIWQKFADEAFRNLPTGSEKIIRTLLFAEISWKQDAFEWAALKENQDFIRRICRDFGHHPLVFAPLVKLFITIGQTFLPEALLWLHEAFKKGEAPHLLKTRNTVPYLEKLLRNSLFRFGTEIRKQPFLRQAVLDLLDALVDSRSYVAYQLRERLVAPIPLG